MTDPGPLGAFLAARRAQLQPEQVGLPTYGERRRVAGLRREEVAQLSGVGFSYYSRLEQGQSRGASLEVLDAIARTLQLDEAERRHLHTLATPPARRPRQRSTPERVSAETLQLLAAFSEVPALVLGRRSEVLAWNPLGHALFAGHLPYGSPNDSAARPNMTRLVFRDAHVRDLYVDWPAKARAVVANLRQLVGAHPEDAGLQQLVGELSIESPEFAAMWADHRVGDCDVALYEMRHPLVGELTVAQQTLSVPLAPSQRLVVATATPGSRAAISLALLQHTLTRTDEDADQAATSPAALRPS